MRDASAFQLSPPRLITPAAGSQNFPATVVVHYLRREISL